MFDSNDPYMPERRDLQRSEDVQEILGTPPSWITRVGTLFCLVALVALFWAAVSIEYPDIVEARMKLSSVDPPRKLKSPKDITVTRIMVASEDTVETTSVLMEFRNPAKLEDVLTLEERMLLVDEKNDSSLLAFDPPSDLILGSLQETFYDFREKQEAFRLAIAGGVGGLSNNQLQRRINQERNAIRFEREQKDNLEAQLNLARERFIREQNLKDRDLSTAERVRERQEDVLRYERMVQSATSSINNRMSEINLLRREMENYRSGRETTAAQAVEYMRQAYSLLQQRLSEWKQENLLLSNINGIVVLPPDLRDQQLVLRGTLLATILPLNPLGILGRIDLPVRGSGKVKVGQRVIVKFDNFPFQEFGAVIGEVTQKSRVVEEREGKNVIPIEVSFPDRLLTTTGVRLEAGADMVGTAEIVTEEKRLIEWIIEKM
jgi:hypothetical protein